MDENFQALMKAFSHLAAAVRFYSDSKKSDTNQEIKCCIKELEGIVEGVSVEFE